MEERKVVSIEERIPKLKQSRKKKANRRLIIYLTILFLLIGIVIYLQSPLSDVKNITVEGEQNMDESTIIDNSGITVGTNFWKVDPETVARNLEKHKEIKDAVVSRDFPSTITVEITESERIGYVVKNGQFIPILENGTILNEASPVPGGDAPVLIGFNKATYLKEMSRELKELPQSVFNLISEIHWTPEEGNPYQVKLFMNDGFQVQASIRNFSSKMAAYPSIVSQLDEGVRGIVHIGVGAYFEAFPSQDRQEEKKDERQEEG